MKNKTKTNEVSHTPTPWHFEESSLNGVPKGESFWLANDTEEGNTTAHLLLNKAGHKDDAQVRVDAAFIVRAVNAHEEMLEALKGAMMIVKALSSDNDTHFVKLAEQAIAKAEGK